MQELNILNLQVCQNSLPKLQSERPVYIPPNLIRAKKLLHKKIVKKVAALIIIHLLPKQKHL